MARDNPRRDQIAEAATGYVLEHGLIGLSLRPMAAWIGTSDRMLLYHFGSKDDLVAAVLQVSNDRSVLEVRALPPAADARSAVRTLWSAMCSTQLERCQRMYVEAAALGLFGQEPYASVVRDANKVWLAALADHLVTSGCPRVRAPRAATLLDAALSGFLLDLPLDPDDHAQARAVEDLADAVAAVAAS
ncbi:TetR/AcrR family transcriptional regulator [soil metagenome]